MHVGRDLDDVCAWLTPAQVHPCVCGEYRAAFAASWGVAGSPPHMRGIHLRMCAQIADEGSTPAYAGNTLVKWLNHRLLQILACHFHLTYPSHKLPHPRSYYNFCNDIWQLNAARVQQTQTCVKYLSVFFSVLPQLCMPALVARHSRSAYTY